VSDLAKLLAHALWRDDWDAPQKRAGRGWARRTYEETARSLIQSEEFRAVCRQVAAEFPESLPTPPARPGAPSGEGER